MATQSDDDFPVTFYYAFKQSEKQIEGVASTGWATFLEAVVMLDFKLMALGRSVQNCLET